jgi:hypothetical protein
MLEGPSVPRSALFEIAMGLALRISGFTTASNKAP